MGTTGRKILFRHTLGLWLLRFLRMFRPFESVPSLVFCVRPIVTGKKTGLPDFIGRGFDEQATTYQWSSNVAVQPLRSNAKITMANDAATARERYLTEVQSAEFWTH